MHIGVFTHWTSVVAQGSATAAWYAFALLVAVNFIPVIPIPVIAAAAGAVFHFWVAFLVAWGGAAVGAILKFLLERVLLQRHLLKLSGRFRISQTVLAFLEQHGFTAILITRMIPVFPSSVINLAGAVAKIPIRTFVVATLMGKLPTMLAFTLAGSQLRRHLWTTVALVALYGALMVLAGWRLRLRLRQFSLSADKQN